MTRKLITLFLALFIVTSTITTPYFPTDVYAQQSEISLPNLSGLIAYYNFDESGTTLINRATP